MSKHTPGPWEIHRSGMDRPYEISHGEERRMVITWGGIARPASAEAEANARLIAAAPDLLEALVDAESQIRSHLSLLKCDREFIDKQTEKARLAIARARGES